MSGSLWSLQYIAGAPSQLYIACLEHPPAAQFLPAYTACRLCARLEVRQTLGLGRSSAAPGVFCAHAAHGHAHQPGHTWPCGVALAAGSAFNRPSAPQLAARGDQALATAL